MNNFKVIVEMNLSHFCAGLTWLEPSMRFTWSDLFFESDGLAIPNGNQWRPVDC